MDRIYRIQRHFYDLTRKYYLLGRDRLIRELEPLPGQTVCEIGCGTARNLVKMARRHPDCRYFGIDASAEMLETAEASLRRAGLEVKVRLGLAYAEEFDPKTTFDEAGGFDHIVFSYSLSMIPPWQDSLERAVSLLRPGGTLHIVDFGDQRGMPVWFRRLLFTWLSWFHVEHRPGLRVWVECQAAGENLTVSTTSLAGHYADLYRLRKPEPQYDNPQSSSDTEISTTASARRW
ncbi:class I SAM-dependent methyltransferase [Nisaea sp.]|uniref:class I SAM-dependent methyltransferase n=1 Tax=Nisaea sp. TaxID=2024842 RepID=UPI003267110B